MCYGVVILLQCGHIQFLCKGTVGELHRFVLKKLCPFKTNQTIVSVWHYMIQNNNFKSSYKFSLHKNYHGNMEYHANISC